MTRSLITPISEIALRTMLREPLEYQPGKGWTPGYVCPSADRHRIPFNSLTIDWLIRTGWARKVKPGQVTITQAGRRFLASRDELRDAA